MENHDSVPASGAKNHLRFHAPNLHLASVFGNDWFALKAEAFARFFGTPTFLVTQTVIVAGWIAANSFGLAHFDIYPFILLNLAFSLQAAYAAPLILLAQTRQADRDKASSDADARHREEIFHANEQRQADAAARTELLLELIHQNTRLTETTKALSERIEILTEELHRRMIIQP
jgi:uncharacterized membrane protein